MPKLRHLKYYCRYIKRHTVVLLQGLIIPFRLARTHRTVSKKIMDETDYIELDDETLKNFIDTEWTRAKELDDKLQKLTAVLSVSITVGGLVGTTMLSDLPFSWLKVSSVALFLIAAAYLFFGTILGFNGLQPKPRWGYGAKFLRAVASKDTEARRELICAATESERGNILRANEAYAATISIRNGVIFFALGVLLSLLAATKGSSREKQSTTQPQPAITNIVIKGRAFDR